MYQNYITLNKKLSSSQSLEFNIFERKVILALVDFIILSTSLLYYYKLNLDKQFNITEIIQQNYPGIIYGILLFWFISIIFNLYNFEFAHKTRKILPLVFFIGIFFSISFIFTPIITPTLPDQRIILIGFTLGFTFLLALWRTIYAHVFHSNFFLSNTLVLVSNKFNEKNIEKVRESIEGINYQYGYKIQRIYKIPVDDSSIEDLSRTLDKIITKKIIDNIIILDKNHRNISKRLNIALIKAIQCGVNVQTYLKVYEELREALPIKFAGRQFYSIFPISRYNTNYIFFLWHRLIDLFSSFFGIFAMLSLTPFIILFNYFLNRGPLFYSQFRVGKGGKEFKIVKFRSMVIDAEKQGAKMSTKGDSRITTFGKFLRKTRIDELPQFWAVLKGDMSLIGPRPERKIFVDQLSKEIPFYNTRHLINPGITGWAQVKYPYGENLKDSYNKLEYDLYYIKNRSIVLDIRIILKTINTIIFSKGQ